MSTAGTLDDVARAELRAQGDKKPAGGHAAATPGGDADTPKLSPEKGSGLARNGMILAVVGLGLSGAAFAVDKERFGYSYLTGFFWMATVCLGALFFVILQHLVRAGWSVAARRQAEWLAGALPATPVLFVPLALLAPQIWHKWMGPEAAHDELLHKKHAYLNTNFFFGRAAVYFLIWTALSLWFAKRSRQQDADGKIEHTNAMQAMSAPATLLFALSITFAGFDWLMSLDPHWYSTIFGVYIFAGSVTSSLSAIALLTIALQSSGYFKRVSTVEHRHDIGKLLFGFTVFWAYIAFSQFFLIWYANLPEETIFYRERLVGDWAGVSMLLLFGHFIVPFAFLLSRHPKRSMKGLAIAASWMLFMHYVDMYWLVMPALDHHGPHFSWIDLAGLLGPLGVAAALITRQASTGNLFPTQDPRLPETYKVENL